MNESKVIITSKKMWHKPSQCYHNGVDNFALSWFFDGVNFADNWNTSSQILPQLSGRVLT